jgi:Na+-driven multidrug efflux pump
VRQSTKLILNTSVTYFRMLITVGMGLLVTRLMVKSLGQEDYGVWSGLVAIVSIALMFSDGVNNAGDRFLSFELGRGDSERIRATFRTLMVIFLSMAGLTLVLGLPLIEVVLSLASVPAERADAARTAYLLTLGFTALLMIICPFRSMLLSRQSVVALSALEMSDSVLKLGVVAVGLLMPGDKLVWVCWALLVQQAISVGLSAGMCWWLVPESRPGLSGITRERFVSLAGYTTWSIVSTISYRIRITGPQLLIMSWFGPLVQASYAVASQLAGYQLSLGSVVSRITQPALVAAEGRGDRVAAVKLIHLVNKYSTLLILCYMVPLQIEVATLLKLWLNAENVGPEAPALVRMVLIVMAMVWTFNGYWIASAAMNRVRGPVLLSLVCDSTMVLLGWVAIKFFGASPWVVPAIGAGMMVVIGMGFTIIASRALKIPASSWFTECWWPVLKSAGPAGLAASVWVFVLEPSLVRVVLVGATFAMLLFPLAWFLSMGAEERGHFERVFRSLSDRVRRKPAAGA